MAKLKDDQIRWILSLDAKGVQGELVQVSSVINKLKKENSDLEKEMKKAEIAMNQAEKTMMRLIDAGKTNTLQYQLAKKEYESNKKTLSDLRAEIELYNREIELEQARFEELNKTLKIGDMTMNQLRQRAADLQTQLNQTSASVDPKAYKQLQKELEQVNKRMFDVQTAGKSMLSQFASMNNPVGSAAKAVQGFIQVLNYLVKHPIVAIIVLIVSLFMQLKDAITQNEEAMNTLNRIMEPFKQILNVVIDAIMTFVNWLLKFVETVLNSLMKLAEYLPFVGKWFKQINEESEKAVQLEKDKQALAEKHRKNIQDIAEKENKIAQLRAKAAEKDKYDAKQRIELLEEAKDLELEILDLKREELQAEIDILNRATEKVKKTTEWKNQIAEAGAALTRLNTEYFNKEMSLNKTLAAARLEDQREAADAAKKALDERLKNEENALNQQINQLKQARLQGLITEKDYNKQVEQLTIESLHRKINIRGQEKDKIIQLEAQILDAQIKQQTEADRELLEELIKTKENQLSILESNRNEELEILQEQESDQKIYALRAAEIEANNAAARLAVIRQFSETLQQAEFENAQIRLDAIEANGKDIIDAESRSLKEQERLRKLFARTTADFERQYNIKTWEQRKDDELRILQRQYDEKLISEETKQAALLAIEKKYDDEKLRVRQQYGIASMKDLYDAEMQMLLENYEKGLLTLEEYEAAKLQIKLKYAQEYAAKAEELLNKTANLVSDLMSAEMANIETKYDAEIQAAGNNAKEVARLENEKAKKKLDVEKKYADVQFAITAAQIVANTAMAIMQAFAQLGPIAGAIAAVIVGAAGVAQLVVANAQRQKVKQMSLSGGGAAEAPRTGQIRVKEGYAEGGSNIGDHTDGGYTGAGERHEVAGWVPYHHGEYFVAVPEMKNPAVQDHIRAIDKIRRQRTTKNALPAGFAEGGANIDAAANVGQSNRESNETNQKLIELLDGLISGQIAFRTNYGVTEYQAAERQKLESESIFTR